MEAKENRPDACAASGTANSIYKDFSTDAPDIQEELTGLVLPDDCAADIVSFCSEQTIAYDDLLEYATLFYLQDKDPEDPPFRDTLKFELLTLTNRCIDAYNFGKRDPNAGPGAKLKDAYPDKKEGAERYKRLSGLHTLQIAVILYKLHHAVGILWNNSHDDGNFDIGIYQYSGDNEGCYDVGEQNLKSLIRGYCKTGTIKDVNETIEALRAICPRVERCRNRDLVAVNNGIYDYGNKILMAFDPAFVFTSKKHVDFVDHARNPVIHNDEDGTDWDVVSWMNELSDDPDVVSLLWQIIGATVRPYVSWNKSAWLYSPSGNNGKGTLCTLLRNLCGAGDWTSIPLKNFGKDFMLTSLMHASVIITDENDTGTFVDDAASLKSIITGDPFQMNRKNRDPRDVLFNGFMVQCVNEIPRVRDKSESMLRRLLVIPFDKRFEGCERKYIKGDYLNRPEVLEYVLYHVLAETDYYELDEPDACLALLDDFRLTNDPVRQFLDDILIRATWDVLPWQFVFDLYRRWFIRNNPSGRCQSRKSLINDVKGIISDYEGWDYSDNPVSVPDEMYDTPEGLIGIYEVREWEEPGYRGSNPNRSHLYRGSKRTRGLVRVGVAASEDAAATDSTIMYFDVPDERKQWLVEHKKEGSAYKIIGGVVMGRLASACWFTNLDHNKRHEPLLLDTMEHNLKFNKRLRKKLEKDYGKLEYPHYDNYDAIEVPFVEAIPSDYDGVMGVPITFLDKYNPEQFEIVAFRKGEDGKDLVFTREREFNRTFVSLFDSDCGDDKKRRRQDKWEDYLRQNHGQTQIEPIDYFFPSSVKSRAAGSMNGTINGKETYRRVLICRKGGNN